MSKELRGLEALNKPVGSKFKVNIGNGITKTVKVVSIADAKSLCYLNGNDQVLDQMAFNTNTLEKYKFIPVPQPVKFTTAVIAFNERKTIYSIYKDERSIYDHAGEHCDSLEDKAGFAISSNEILKGKWYIEEE